MVIFPIGPLVDRVSRRLPLIVGAAAMAVSMTATNAVFPLDVLAAAAAEAQRRTVDHHGVVHLAGPTRK